MPKTQSEDKQREADKWHREARGPARRLRGDRGGRCVPAPRLGAEQQLSQAAREGNEGGGRGEGEVPHQELGGSPNCQL